MRGAMIPNCVECALVKEMKSNKGEGQKAKEELKMKVNVMALSMCCCHATDHVFIDGNVRRRRRSNRRHCTGRRDDVPASCPGAACQRYPWAWAGQQWEFVLPECCAAMSFDAGFVSGAPAVRM